MTKLNQIEAELNSIDSARFHSLCNLFLYKEGYKHINLVGKVVGKDKSKSGTPDTLISRHNGKYIFVEITTKEADPGKKFLEDIAKCFDEDKTGIPIEKIEAIILCYNGELTTSETEQISKVCLQTNCQFIPYGIGAIAPALHSHYPNLAKEYLGVEIDTGQILDAENFIRIYGTNKLATPLDTPFFGREQELEIIVDQLKNNDALILTGRPGSGKTRIALEAVERFKRANSDFTSKFILYHGELMHDDIHTYFSRPGKYIVLIDDANRLSELDTFFYLLRDRCSDRIIKLLLTVRDYAVQKVSDAVKKVAACESIQIDNFEEQKLTQMLITSFAINNQDYQRRIYQISQGNPRLAVMCARIALESQNLTVLNNITELYEKYYQSIREDLTEFGDSTLLKIAGIVAFMRVIDFKNETQMNIIQEAFGVSSTIIYEKVRRLNEMEIFDFYDEEVVKVSDQVLSTYLLYLTIFEKKILDIGSLIPNFFSQFRGLFVEALNPVITSFDHDVILPVLEKSLDITWRGWLPDQSQEEQCAFLMVFWFVRPNHTLDILESFIRSLPENTEEITIPSGQLPRTTNTIPEVLRVMQFSDDTSFVTVIKLALDYLKKRPEDEKRIIQLFTKRWAFHYRDHQIGYQGQHLVISVLWNLCDKGKDAVCTHVFLEVANVYLRTHFDTTEGGIGRNTISIIRFELESTQELKDLREKLWDCLIELYHCAEYQEEIKFILCNYHTYSYETKKPEILEQDIPKVLPFCDSILDPSSFSDCTLLHDIVAMYSHHGLIVDPYFEKKFQSEIWMISKMLSIDKLEILMDSNTTNETDRQHRYVIIDNYTREFDALDYKEFFGKCNSLMSYFSLKNKSWQASLIQENICLHLVRLADRQPSLFVEIFSSAINVINPEKGLVCLIKLRDLIGGRQVLETLHKKGTENAIPWVFAHYWTLSMDQVTIQDWQELFDLYRNAEWHQLPIRSDFLLNYLTVEPSAVSLVISNLLERSKDDANYLRILAGFFVYGVNFRTEIVSILRGNVELLQSAYFAVSEKCEISDYDGTLFNTLQDIDADFTLKYLSWLHDQTTNQSVRQHDFSLLWMREGYEQIMTSAVHMLFNNFKYSDVPSIDDLLRFSGNTNADQEVVIERQTTFINSLIATNANDAEMMKWLFLSFLFHSDVPFFKYLLVLTNHNSDEKLLMELPLEPGMMSWSGSAIPVYQQKIALLEDFRSQLDPIKFSEYRRYISRHIDGWKDAINSQARSEWMDNWLA